MSLPSPLLLSLPSHPLIVQSSDIDLSSISEKQAESNNSAYEEIESSSSNNKKEKADWDNGHDRDTSYGGRATRDAGGVRASFKRSTDIANLDEGGKDVPRSEKARRLDEFAGQSANPIAKYRG